MSVHIVIHKNIIFSHIIINGLKICLRNNFYNLHFFKVGIFTYLIKKQEWYMIDMFTNTSLEINHMQMNWVHESRSLKADMNLQQALFES